MSDAPATPFAMLGGEGLVCEGDVCFMPGFGEAGAESASAIAE